MNVRVLGAAQSGATEIADWYRERSDEQGRRFLAALDRLVERLVRQPRLYGRVHRTRRGREIRQAPIGRFPVVAIYEVTASELVILDVRHAKRRPRRL